MVRSFSNSRHIGKLSLDRRYTFIIICLISVLVMRGPYCWRERDAIFQVNTNLNKKGECSSANLLTCNCYACLKVPSRQESQNVRPQWEQQELCKKL